MSAHSLRVRHIRQMKLNLHFLEAEAPLSALRDQLTDEATALVEQIDNIVPARLRRQFVDVVIQSVAGEDEGTISGHCFRHSFVTVSLTITDTHFAHAMALGQFRHTLARQLHLALRWGVLGSPSHWAMRWPRTASPPSLPISSPVRR